MPNTHPDHEISAYIRVKPEEAKKRLLAALREAGMHKGEAAKALGCAYTTLLKWIDKLDLEETIQSMTERAEREGWHHGRKGGRPVGSTVANGAAPRGSRVNPG